MHVGTESMPNGKVRPGKCVSLEANLGAGAAKTCREQEAQDDLT